MSTIFIAERMASTDVASYLRTGRYQVASVDTAVQNGAIVKLNGLLNSTDREVYKCIQPAAITDTNLYIVDTPEVVYSQETVKGLDDFTNLAGTNARLRRPKVGDFFAISDVGIDPLTTLAAIAVGNVLTVKASDTLWEEKAAAGGTETLVATIVDSYTLGFGVGGRAITMFGCEVTKAD